MNYFGEHLLPGQLGHFFIVLSLVASLVATFAYAMASYTKPGLIADSSVTAAKARIGLRILTILFLAGCLFYLGAKYNIFTSHKVTYYLISAGFLTTAIVGYIIHLATRNIAADNQGLWKKLARSAFIVEAVSVLAVFGILFYVIYNHLFEYKYAWQHSSLSLEFKYMFACFWEGQEGSFLLWSFWHCMLGLLLIRTGKQWEAPVMTVVSFAQVCLATMIAGLYIFNWRMGSNPFILLRDSGVLDNAPALHNNFDISQPFRQDYLSSIKDGNDLNPLLQNYWMVIHPPVLFLGFASTIVPFAFAIAGLWLKKFGEWTRPALPWALFSSAVLGVGIMMGAAWAYESLTFGGYWAWDPVENASLVPWLVLISGVHSILIYKHSGHSLRSAHLFFIFAFGFVLYSTFLTRSGILGDTSVHAFTDLGMNIQLYMLLYVFIWLPAVFAAKDNYYKKVTGITASVLLAITFLVSTFLPNIAPAISLITLVAGLGFIIYHVQTQVPAIKKEESASSREFWMFIGALVFFLSAIVIIGKTSLPVLNKVTGLNIAAPADPEFAYNQIQIFVAIIIAVLTGFAQYLKYKATPARFFWKKIFIPTLIAVIFATVVVAVGNINYDKQGPMYLGAIWLAVACSIYAVIANLAYIWIGLKGKLGLSGGSVAHVGFGLVLLGILLSSSKKEVLSYNTSDIFVPLEENKITGKSGENITLVKGLKTDMGRYWVTYESSEKQPEKSKWFYNLRFQKKDSKEEFVLTPSAFINVKGEGMQANPDSKHYWDHDLFTYPTALPNPERQEDTAAFKTKHLKVGDSLFYSKGFIVVQDVIKTDSLPVDIFGPDGSLHETPLKIYSKTGSIYSVTPKLAFAKGSYLSIPDTITAESLVIQLTKVNPDKSIELGYKESNAVLEYITLKAYQFPFINVLWGGIIITAIGILMSMIRRIRLSRSGKQPI